MLRAIVVLLTAVLLAAPAAAKGPLPEPDDGPDPRGVTVSGVGVSWGSQAAAQQRAIADARARAVPLAAAAGLTLGEVVAVQDRDAHAELGYVYSSQRSPLTTATVAVTFTTAQTATVEGDRAIVGVGVGPAGVRPRNRRSSPSIRAALRRARLTAAPRALREARSDAAALAAAADVPLGPVFSIAEMRRPQQDFSWALGSFGPGRYCGTVRRTIYRRDASGRRRPLRRVSSRRCFYPTVLDVALRVTYVPA